MSRPASMGRRKPEFRETVSKVSDIVAEVIVLKGSSDEQTA